MKQAKLQFKDDILHQYYETIKKIPLLTFEEELELSRRIKKGDEKARNLLIKANLRLVAKIAFGYSSQNASFLDLIQEGNMGLIRAVEKYDHFQNVRFATYAAWWIRQVISRYLSNKRRAIRLPHRKEEILGKAHKAYISLSQSLMRQPKLEEIADEIGVPKQEVEFLVGLSQELLPFDSDPNDDDSSVAEFHEDYTYSPERALMKKSSIEDTRKILKHLKDRERRILIYRFQLNGEKRYTLKNVGSKLGISTEAVRQIEIKALKKLRIHAAELKPYMGAV